MAVGYAGGGITSALDTSTATTTVAAPLYTGTRAGQPIVLAVVSDAASGTFTTPTGWTAFFTSVNILTDMSVAVYYKYSSGAESSTVTVTGPSGHMIGASVSLQGATAASMQAHANAASASAATASPTSGGTLTPAVTANGMAVRVVLMSTNVAEVSATLTPPASPWTTQQKFINSTTTSAFCTGICISTNVGSAPAAAASSGTFASAWEVLDVWFLDAFDASPNVVTWSAIQRASAF